MKESTLKKLIDNTFLKIASPLKGNGVYAEIQKAVMEAYTLGKKGKRVVAQQMNDEVFSMLSE